jgi:hypothetical protein
VSREPSEGSSNSRCSGLEARSTERLCEEIVEKRVHLRGGYVEHAGAFGLLHRGEDARIAKDCDEAGSAPRRELLQAEEREPRVRPDPRDQPGDPLPEGASTSAARAVLRNGHAEAARAPANRDHADRDLRIDPVAHDHVPASCASQVASTTRVASSGVSSIACSSVVTALSITSMNGSCVIANVSRSRMLAR